MSEVRGQMSPRLNTLEGNPSEMRSDKLNATRCDSDNLTRYAVVNELHGVNPVQPQYDFPNLRGRLGRDVRDRRSEGMVAPMKSATLVMDMNFMG